MITFDEEDLKQIKSSITRRYMSAVLIIALLSTGAFYVLKSALNDSDSTALIVNISGKQRMLSQHIALDAHRLYTSLKKNKPAMAEQVKDSLYIRTLEMQTANKRLSSGKLTKDQFIPLSATISDMYFGPLNLAERVNAYTRVSHSLVKAETVEEAELLLKQLDQKAENLLKDLNKVVLQYQHEGEQKLRFLVTLETSMWLLTLLILILEVVFIFKPMTSAVIRASVKERGLMETLQDQVELRTIKLEEANQRLVKLASHDPLTGIKNRLTLESDIEALINGYKLNKQDFGLVIADIDWFKNVNDDLGHDFGDFVIKEFSKLLQAHIRDGDSVYRFGGEEFVVLMNRINLDALFSKVDDIRKLVQYHEFEQGKNKISITASFGVFHSSLFKRFALSDVIKFADGALYESKSLGRNRVTVAEKSKSTITNIVQQKEATLIYSDLELTSLVSASHDIESILGYSAKQLIADNMAFEHLIYEKDKDVLKLIHHCFQTHTLASKTIRLQDNQGNVIIARINGSMNKQQYQISIQKAVDLVKPFGDELLVQNFHAMMENTNDFIYFKDSNHVFTAASATLVNLTSVDSREDLVGKTDYDVFQKELADEYFILEKEIFSGEVEVSRRFQKTLDKDGNSGWVDNRKYPIYNNLGEIVGLFGVARVISQQEYESLVNSEQN